jgi:hypothetical protein
MVGAGLVALSVTAAIVIQFTTGQFIRVKSEQTAPGTFVVFVDGGVNKANIPIVLCFVAGVACLVWPRGRSSA